jgi:hypothetical protein
MVKWGVDDKFSRGFSSPRGKSLWANRMNLAYYRTALHLATQFAPKATSILDVVRACSFCSLAYCYAVLCCQPCCCCCVVALFLLAVRLIICTCDTKKTAGF